MQGFCTLLHSISDEWGDGRIKLKGMDYFVEMLKRYRQNRYEIQETKFWSQLKSREKIAFSYHPGVP